MRSEGSTLSVWVSHVRMAVFLLLMRVQMTVSFAQV